MRERNARRRSREKRHLHATWVVFLFFQGGERKERNGCIRDAAPFLRFQAHFLSVSSTALGRTSLFVSLETKASLFIIQLADTNDSGGETREVCSQQNKNMRLLSSHRALGALLALSALAIVGLCAADDIRSIYVSPDGAKAWNGDCPNEFCTEETPCSIRSDVITMNGLTNCTIFFAPGNYGNTTIVSPNNDGTFKSLELKLNGTVSGLDMGVSGVSSVTVVSATSTQETLRDSLIVVNPIKTEMPAGTRALALKRFNATNSFFVVQHGAETVNDGASVLGFYIDVTVTDIFPPHLERTTHIAPQYLEEVQLAVISLAGPIPTAKVNPQRSLFVGCKVSLPLAGTYGLLNLINRQVLGPVSVDSSSVSNAAFIVKASDPPKNLINFLDATVTNLGNIVQANFSASYLSSWNASQAISVHFDQSEFSGSGVGGFGHILPLGTVCANVKVTGSSDFSRMSFNWITMYDNNDSAAFRCSYDLYKATLDNSRIKFLGGATSASPTVQLASVTFNINDTDSSVVFDGVAITSTSTYIVRGGPLAHSNVDAVVFSRNVTFLPISQLYFNYAHLKRLSFVELSQAAFNNASLLLGPYSLLLYSGDPEWHIWDTLTIDAESDAPEDSEAGIALLPDRLIMGPDQSILTSPMVRTSGAKAYPWITNIVSFFRDTTLFWDNRILPAPVKGKIYSLGVFQIVTVSSSGTYTLICNEFPLTAWLKKSTIGDDFFEILFSLKEAAPPTTPIAVPKASPPVSSPVWSSPPFEDCYRGFYHPKFTCVYGRWTCVGDLVVDEEIKLVTGGGRLTQMYRIMGQLSFTGNGKFTLVGSGPYLSLDKCYPVSATSKNLVVDFSAGLPYQALEEFTTTVISSLPFAAGCEIKGKDIPYTYIAPKKIQGCALVHVETNPSLIYSLKLDFSIKKKSCPNVTAIIIGVSIGVVVILVAIGILVYIFKCRKPATTEYQLVPNHY